MRHECPDCGKYFSGRKCSCGFSPVEAKRTYDATKCPVDGGTLLTGSLRGFCERGGGYPATMDCPFVCPHCRHALDWSGGCFGCHGVPSGDREAWTFPGDGYYTHDEEGTPLGDGLHYLKVLDGPRPATSRGVNVANAHCLVVLMKTPVVVESIRVADVVLGPQL